jgi:hypothetical protein
MLLKFLFIYSTFQLGIIPEHDLSLYKIPDYQEGLIITTTWFVDYTVKARIFKYAFISGGMTTFMFKWQNQVNYYPIRTDFTFGAGIKYKNVEVGWSHECYHPIAPNSYAIPLPRIDSMQEIFYVKCLIGKEPE